MDTTEGGRSRKDDQISFLIFSFKLMPYPSAWGPFINYVCIQGWVGGQQNATFTTVNVQTMVRGQKMQK